MGAGSISIRTRFEVLKRDGFTCQYCGRNRDQDNVKLHVDHVVPVKEGGGDELDNLVAACQDCNLGKAAKRLDALAPVVDLAEQTRLIREREDKIRAYGKVKRAEKRRMDDELSECWDYWFDVWDAETLPRAACPWKNVLRTSVTQLGVAEVKDAMDIVRAKFAAPNGTSVRYFGGVVKRKKAQMEGRIVPCTHCHVRIILTVEQANNYTDRDHWIHASCAESIAEAKSAAEAEAQEEAESLAFEDEIDAEVRAWDDLANAAGF